jgi:hypothetical protein
MSSAKISQGNDEQEVRTNWVKRLLIVTVLWLPILFQINASYMNLNIIWQLAFAVAVVGSCMALTWRAAPLEEKKVNWKLGCALWGTTWILFILTAPILSWSLGFVGYLEILPADVYGTVMPILAPFMPWGAFGVATSAVLWTLANLGGPTSEYEGYSSTSVRRRAAGAGSTVAGVAVVNEYESNDTEDSGGGFDFF